MHFLFSQAYGQCSPEYGHINIGIRKMLREPFPLVKNHMQVMYIFIRDKHLNCFFTAVRHIIDFFYHPNFPFPIKFLSYIYYPQIVYLTIVIIIFWHALRDSNPQHSEAKKEVIVFVCIINP